METTPILNDASHWRRRAADAYRVAEQLDDPLAKSAMLDLRALMNSWRSSQT
jgi:hypothetical protein